MSTFSIPIGLKYNGQDCIGVMGPFERSMERDFALVANKKALSECNDMQEAVTALVKENLELRQAMQLQERDLEAADQLLGEAAEAVTRFAEKQQSAQAKKFPWPFGW
jgi:type II secretory pathway component PulJ